MNPDVTDAEDHAGKNHREILAVNSQQEECRNRKRRAGNGNLQYAAVKVAHFLPAAEITHPEDFIQHHQGEGNAEPEQPEMAVPQIEVGKDNGNAADKHLADSFECQKELIFVADIFLVILRLVLCPDDIGDKQHDKINQSHIRKTETHSSFLLQLII